MLADGKRANIPANANDLTRTSSTCTITSSRALQQRLFSLLQRKQQPALEHLTQIHAQILINGFSRTKNFLLAPLLSFYSYSSAHSVFKDLQSPSTILWNQMIRVHARSQSPANSIQFFNQMLLTDARPDAYTYSFLLAACTSSLSLRAGQQVHSKVLTTGYYSSNVFLMSKLVNFYAAAALNLFGQMRKAGVELDRVVLLAALTACAELGDLKMGMWIHSYIRNTYDGSSQRLASHVSQNLVAEPDPDKAAGYLSLLAHVHATAEKWQDVAAVRQKMVAMGAKKPAGQSWVQINEVVHDFVAGDRTHKNTSSIYEMLGKSHQASKKEGGRLGEDEMRKFFLQMILCCGTLQKKAAHKDLKLESSLLGLSKTNVFIADFWVDKRYVPLSFCYIAGPPSDVWNCGVVLLAMLFDNLPMDGDESNASTDLIQIIKGGMYTLPGHISDDAKDLITRIIVASDHSSKSSTQMIDEEIEFDIEHARSQPIQNSLLKSLGPDPVPIAARSWVVKCTALNSFLAQAPSLGKYNCNPQP
ncbi:hypothetical protein SADUNF_Sadunf08G0001400 [Salix dunnii]|uniref:Protein kinase domain-containing protein n=1 Tax=Salix dunnii TaxID=1413687 RepID=A0A835MWW5_9ROSI|nr:hypothetical protein SADUNF_Sadunf08G0001400 [Salix dunnii]